jgi:hypothetical protein
MASLPPAAWAGIAAAALVLAVLTVIVLLPTLVRGRVEAALERRLGMVARIETITLRPGRASMRDLVLSGRHGGVRFTVDRAEARGSLLGLARRAADSLHGATVDGARVWIDLTDPGAEESLRELREALAGGARAPGGGPRGRGGLSRILADDFTFSIDEGSAGWRAGDGEHMGLEHFTATVEPAGPGQYASTGRGELDSGGTIGWDLGLWPAESRVEGSLAFDSLSLVLVAPVLPRVPWHRPEEGTLDGRVSIRNEGGGVFRIDGSADLRGAAVASEGIAPDPVEIRELRVAGAGTWMPERRRLEVERATVSHDGVEVVLAGTVEGTEERVLVDLRAELPATLCADALAVIPHGLLAELADFRLAGTLAVVAEVRVDSERPGDTELAIATSDACEFLEAPAAVGVERFRSLFVHHVEEGEGRTFTMVTGPGSERWTPLGDISPFLVHAVLAHEDPAFFRHRGFAPWAIRDALARNLEEGRFAWGASTITMQLARNLYLQRTKTLARKVREVVLAWWLERSLTKGEMMELYLNVIEFGPAVYGIGQATEHYFGVAPSRLTPAQAAFFAVILPAPRSYHQQVETGGLGPSTAAQMRALLARMHGRGQIDDDAFAHGLAELETLTFGPRLAADEPTYLGAAAPLPVPTAPLPER